MLSRALGILGLLGLWGLWGFSSPALSAPPFGDSLVDASIAEATNLIPALANDTSSMAVVGQVYRGLVKYDENLKLVGDLAESWDISEDQRTVTFHLKKGIVWEDGTPFTAQDSLFTWKLMSDPLVPTSYGADFQEIEEASAPDDYTFSVTYRRTMANAVAIWGFSQMPKRLLEGANLDESPLARQPVGNGPFRLENWEVGQRMTLAASETFEGGRPPLNRLITLNIPDQATQFMELKSGALDMMTLTPDQWLEAQDDRLLNEAYNFFRHPAFAYSYLGFNLQDPRLSDARVRRAINYAIDKEEIVAGVLLGLGRAANGPFKPDMWSNNQNLPPFPFDPDQARRLFQEAGWADADGDGILEKDGQKFVLNIMTNQGNKTREQVCLIIQARLKEVGVDARVRIVEWAALTKEYLDNHDFEAVLLGWTIPLDPDLYDVFNSTKTKKGELNFVGYGNPEVDALIDEARFNLDQGVRKAALDRIQEIFYEDAPYVFLYVPDNLVAISKRFVGPKVAPIGVVHEVEKWYVPLDRQVYVE
ncbi:MAG: peptide-binding protein [Deltaproteobacteria bacterium]|nr:peptide-binding protein [Deltaproteobacteria bacterium]